MELRKGDILLAYGDGFIGEVIEEFENSEYCHTAGIVGVGLLIESNGFKKTGYENISIYKGKADIFTCDILTDEQRKKIVEYVKGEIGTVYDWILLFEEAIRLAFHIVISHKEFHNHICSTLWNDAYMSIGIILCPNIKYPSPADIGNSRMMRKIGVA